MKISWTQALAWRLRRQLLDPIGTEPVEEVVRRLGAIQSGEAFATELAVRTRRQRSQAGEVTEALRDGRLIKSFAFRGATHLMTPEEGGIYLALRASARMWELPSWQAYYGLAPSDWPALWDVAREALAAGPLTVKELIAAIAAPQRFHHLGPILAGNPWSVMKAIAWHGDMSFGQMQGRQGTFQRLDAQPAMGRRARSRGSRHPGCRDLPPRVRPGNDGPPPLLARERARSRQVDRAGARSARRPDRPMSMWTERTPWPFGRTSRS